MSDNWCSYSPNSDYQYANESETDNYETDTKSERSNDWPNFIPRDNESMNSDDSSVEEEQPVHSFFDIIINKDEDLRDQIPSLRKSFDDQLERIGRYVLENGIQEDIIREMKDRNDSLTADNQNLNEINRKLTEENERLIQKCRQQEKQLSENICEKNCQNIIDALNERLHTLTNSRDYYRKQSQNLKQKALSVSHTVIKQQGVYKKAIRDQYQQNEKTSIKLIDDVKRETIQIFDKSLVNTKKYNQQNYERTQIKVDKELKHINAAERRMQTKRADGKVPCGSCDKMYDTMSALKQHTTKTHKMLINYWERTAKARQRSQRN